VSRFSLLDSSESEARWDRNLNTTSVKRDTQMHRYQRLFTLLVLIVLVTALCVHYGSAYEENWPHPTGDELAEDPDGWDGERVLLFGTVSQQTDEGFVMTVERDNGETARMVAVQERAPSVDEGGTVQVYGELSDRATVQQADSIVVVNQNAGAGRYKLLVSVLGVVLAAGSFLWYWGIDWRRLAFYTRRSGGDRNG